MRAHALTGALAVTAAALVLASCGGDTAAVSTPGGAQPPDSSPHQTSDHNQADTAFAQGMIPHHAQAIEMAHRVPNRTSSSRVRDLARRIEQAQGSEITTMTAWLRAWNAAVPPTGQSGADHRGTDTGDGGQPPGATELPPLHQLDQATDAELDRLFLQLMIRHHEDAVAMARTELAGGRNPEATRLAQRILETQQTEIQELQQLLAQN